jgi:hypothetical protein
MYIKVKINNKWLWLMLITRKITWWIKLNLSKSLLLFNMEISRQLMWKSGTLKFKGKRKSLLKSLEDHCGKGLVSVYEIKSNEIIVYWRQPSEVAGYCNFKVFLSTILLGRLSNSFIWIQNYCFPILNPDR